MDKKNSFIGELLIIIVIIIFICIITQQIKINDLKQIQKINKNYNISENKLYSEDNIEYIALLSESKNKTAAEAIIEYIKFIESNKELEKIYKLNLSYGNGCISKEYLLKTETIYLKKNKVLALFKEEEDNKEYIKYIFWDKYIYDLETNYDFLLLKSEIKKNPICDS
ncbi:MAG: hypothetical protein PHR26_03935 [Candidatus ainarchaeum sp.]|nr:hypothetical protein [Candidatus ainarchaeum sp.]MDD3976340.1 hypothetical protein [Candidatus ainarchaeum sp.]